ncbi:TetR family transcriptional regulator [Nocardia sp. ET3-3]|uniref:TetR family transcriptional regulator n=1 Tax=Nocardia terrae TaxID=2675851 RepID=A0A7K1UZT5_9NOCA|nr:TetR/AcrR family transcriptional regulator [Nocardia terrae]MVU79791.1 TetR family transcriptional regulator [Nocardia terrae]
MPATRQLPRGRHGLPRETVVAAQRDRILLAMAEAMTENGYVGTPVAAVIKRAGVSRETFYEQFRSKEDCFEAAYERAVELMLTGVLAATGAEFDGETRTERMGRLLGAYLEALAGQPAYARLFLVEVYAVGPEAIARRTQLQETFVAMVADVLGADTESQRFACQTLVAALSAMVTARIAVGDLDGLRELREPLLDLVRRSGELFGDTVLGD